jgi:hypothetical protein
MKESPVQINKKRTTKDIANGCSSIAQHVLSIYQARGSVARRKRARKRRRKGERKKGKWKEGKKEKV